jgi:hypothetical protein
VQQLAARHSAWTTWTAFWFLLLMTSSMRRIMAADSAADFIACSLTTAGSITPLSMLFWILPVKTFTPWYLPSALSCAERSSTSMSIGSRPAFSLSARGYDFHGVCEGFNASCSLPPTLFAYLRSSFATSISTAPPPATILLFSITSLTTLRVSLSWLFRLRRPGVLSLRVEDSYCVGVFAFFDKDHFVVADFAFFNLTCSCLSHAGFRSSRSETIRAPVALQVFPCRIL